MLTILLVFLLVVIVVLPLLGWTLWLAISNALVGLVIGGLGRLVAPGHQRMGLLATIVVGIGGSLVGGVVARAVGTGDLGSLLLQVGAAALGVVLWSRR